MAYNLTILDARNRYVTLYLTPNRAPRVVHENIATNHQGIVEWNEYAFFSKTLERKAFLEHCFTVEGENCDTILNQFLREPLYHTDYERSFGTLYAAAYQVRTKEVTYAWPRKEITLGYENFEEKKV